MTTPTLVDILSDNAITSKPSWLTSGFTSTGNTLTNSDGHTFTVYQSNTTYAAGTQLTLGANNGNASSEMYSIVFPTYLTAYTQTMAYIAKEASVAAANSGAGLGADSVTINGTLAGVAGSTYILDETHWSSPDSRVWKF